MRRHYDQVISYFSTKTYLYIRICHRHEFSCFVEFIKLAGGRDKTLDLRNIVLLFPIEFNKFNNTGAQMVDSILHIILFCHCIS